MKPITLFVLFMTFPAFLTNASPVEVGAVAPVLTVKTDQGESLDLGKLYESGPVLVYFYPKADTPGCTAQACNLRDNFDDLQAAGITVIGVSADVVAKQADFKEKYQLPFTLIADSDKELGKAFGVGNYMGAAYKRQSFLVVNGKIAWRDLSARPSSQSEDVLAALKGN